LHWFALSLSVARQVWDGRSRPTGARRKSQPAPDQQPPRTLTQQALADRIGVHVVQLRRYESGSSQPTLEVIRRMAVALGVSADLLLFAKDERGPDDELKLQFEAVSRLDPEEKKVIRSLLDSMILRHEAKRWSGTG
jgi:transcriptional regulator with XRE-family HTH domain